MCLWRLGLIGGRAQLKFAWSIGIPQQAPLSRETKWNAKVNDRSEAGASQAAGEPRLGMLPMRRRFPTGGARIDLREEFWTGLPGSTR